MLKKAEYQDMIQYCPLEQKILNKIAASEELLIDSIYKDITESKNTKISLNDLKTEIAVILNEYTTNAFYNIKKQLIEEDF